MESDLKFKFHPSINHSVETGNLWRCQLYDALYALPKLSMSSWLIKVTRNGPLYVWAVVIWNPGKCQMAVGCHFQHRKNCHILGNVWPIATLLDMMTQIGRVNCNEELWPCKLLKIQHGRQLPFWNALFAIFQTNDKGRLAPLTCHKLQKVQSIVNYTSICIAHCASSYLPLMCSDMDQFYL